MWSDVFSPKEPGGVNLKALDAWDLRNSFGQKKSKYNKGNEVLTSLNECYTALLCSTYLYIIAAFVEIALSSYPYVSLFLTLSIPLSSLSFT